MEIYNNEFILLEEENQSIFVTVLKKGFLLRQFYEVIQDSPTIKITKEKGLQESLLLASNNRIEIGNRVPLIELFITKDKMSASVILNCTEKELREKKDFFVGEILKLIHQNKITEGVLVDVVQESLLAQSKIVIAKGKEPVNGKDAEIRYFELSERKPTIRKDGKADYYDMNFIDEVQKGDWLGEKVPATNGISGKTVTGEIVVPKKGKDTRLLYDRKTVEEIDEGDKVILRALIDGVVEFKDGKISVGDHLRIDGDVGVKTGNIDFDGSVTINGIVQTGYSVSATKDISILGEMGLSGIKKISSEKGDIFVKGGLFGQGHSTVKAGKNIFIKHANECVLEAREDINIGYYSIGSMLKAKNILADERNGKIIGGKIEAKGKVVAAILGNRMERKTFIHVEGFSRTLLSEQLVNKLQTYKLEVADYETLKKRIEAFENSSLRKDEVEQLLRMEDELDVQLLKITELDEECKYIASLLEVKGEGEVTIKETAFPETFLEIKYVSKRITSPVSGTFYLESGILNKN
jgi:uncharacterized protein